MSGTSQSFDVIEGNAEAAGDLASSSSVPALVSQNWMIRY